MRFSVGDVVWIRWEDHYHDYGQGWRDNDLEDEAFYCETVGFVLKDTKERLYMSGTLQVHDNAFSGGLSVKVKKNIVDSKVLRKGKK